MTAYTSAYRRAGKSAQGNHALVGALVGCVAYSVLIIAFIAVALSTAAGTALPRG